MADDDSGHEHQLDTSSDNQGHQGHLKTIHNQGSEDLAFINPNSKDKYPQPKPHLQTQSQDQAGKISPAGLAS
jgi:hypothetical protein